MMKLILIFCSICWLQFAFAIGGIDSLMILKETELVQQLDQLRNSKTNAERFSINDVFKQTFKEVLKMRGAYSYSFSKLKSVGVIDSPDKSLRIINWNVELEDNTQLYTCFFMYKYEKNDDYTVVELTDNSIMLPQKPDEQLDNTNWYGALYYQIIPHEKTSKRMYTILGWDGNSTMSTMKVVDVVTLGSKSVKFGSPIFKMNDGVKKRLFFEYAEEASMVLRYEAQEKRIVYDHLSPEAPNLVGIYSYYVPDMTYDALVWKNNKWVLKEDVIGTNKEDPEKIQVYVQDEKTGEVVRRSVKNKWVDPSDKNAPGGANIHVATRTNEEDIKEEVSVPSTKSDDQVKRELDSRTSRWDRRDPNDLESVYGTKRRRWKLFKH